MRFRLIPLLTLAIFLSPVSFANNANSNNSGFDTICQIYTEAENSNINKDQLSDYIFSNIRNRVTSIDALEAHDSVFQLPPSKRYRIFKQAAEYFLKRKWQCTSIESLMK